MKELGNKQKIILIILLAIIASAIIYYVYGLDKEKIYEEELLPYDENIISNTSSSELEETEDGAEIIIYITGAVKNQGVYGLQEGSRIADAIEKAGGTTEEADIEKINLAYLLEDGMKIKIPTKNSNETNEEITKESGLEEENKTTKNQKININTATLEELDTLDGIGKSTAEKIIEYRNKNGKFKTIEDLKNVSGIGESKYEKIKEKITVK